MIIRVPPSTLRSRAGSIEEAAAGIQREVKQARQVIDALRPTFIGNRASNFFKDFDNAYASMEKWDDVVRSYAAELRQIANVIETVDNRR